MQVVLVMFRGEGERRSFSITRDVTVVGRREDCDFRIPLGEISRKHCRIIKDDETLKVEDLGSSNGTFVNEQRISEPCYLKPGDILRVGPFRFLVHYQLSDEAINHLIEILTISATSADESVDVELLDDAG